MIADLAEIWIVLAVPFIVGCLLGALLYRQLAFTPFGPIQNAIVADVDGFFSGIGRSLFGGGRRAKVSRQAAAPVAEAAPIPPAPKAAAAPSKPPPASARPVTPAPVPTEPSPQPVPLAQRVATAASSASVPAPAASKPAPPPKAAPPAPKRPAPPPVAEPIEVAFDVRPPTPEETRDGRPSALFAPRDGRGDDLRRIRGIGESYEARLHGLGIFHFDQIAGWSLVEAAWVAMQTGAGDRVVRYDWIGQARALAGLDNAPPEEE